MVHGVRRAVLVPAACAVLILSCSREPVVVGVSLVLSGLNSEIGVSCRDGIELASETANAAGGVRGRPLKIVVKNDLDDPAAAEAADAELAAAGAVAVIGHMASRSAPLAIEGAARRRIPLISPTVSSPAFSGIDDYFFRVIGESPLQGRALARHAVRTGLRRVAAAYEESNAAYTKGVYEAFRREMEAAGGIVQEAASFRTAVGTDYASVLDEAMAFAPDAVLLAASPVDVAAVCALMEARGIAVPVYAGAWAMTDELSQFGGRSAERAVVAGTVDFRSGSPAYLAFASAYRAKYGKEPTWSAVYGYESLLLLHRALSAAPSLDGPAVKAALLGAGPFEGLQDRFSLDAWGDAARGYFLFRIEDGEFRKIE